MALDLFDSGLIRVTVRYVKRLKPGAPYSYFRRIPEELRPHYKGKRFLRPSLQTQNLAEAAKKAGKITAELEALWSTLRSREGRSAKLTTPENREAARALLAVWGLRPGDLAPGIERPDWFDPGETLDAYFGKRYGEAYIEERHDPRNPDGGERFFNLVEAEAMRQLREDPRKPSVLLSEALARYLADHARGDLPKFADDAKRCIGHVVSAVGDFPLTHYQREHAIKVRESLLSSGNRTTTARRRLNTITAVFNKGLVEFNLRSHGNPFEKLPIAKEARDADTRGTILRLVVWFGRAVAAFQGFGMFFTGGNAIILAYISHWVPRLLPSPLGVACIVVVSPAASADVSRLFHANWLAARGYTFQRMLRSLVT